MFITVLILLRFCKIIRGEWGREEEWTKYKKKSSHNMLLSTAKFVLVSTSVQCTVGENG
jgi:hypothetical protein